jgi:hypothetical protein
MFKNAALKIILAKHLVNRVHGPLLLVDRNSHRHVTVSAFD